MVEHVVVEVKVRGKLDQWRVVEVEVEMELAVL